jgi:hypothetical protein
MVQNTKNDGYDSVIDILISCKLRPKWFSRGNLAMDFPNWPIIKKNNHTMNTPPLEHYVIIPLRLAI